MTMHVREIPSLVFRELVSDTQIQILNVRDYHAQLYPNLYERDPYEYEDTLAVIGEVAGGNVLRQDESDYYSYLHVFPSVGAAMGAASTFDASASLVAGNKETGTWVYGRGEQISQTIWLRLGDNRFTSEEGLTRVIDLAKTISSISEIALRHLNSGLFETSVYFRKDVRPD